jgi:hypothetical protein
MLHCLHLPVLKQQGVGWRALLGLGSKILLLLCNVLLLERQQLMRLQHSLPSCRRLNPSAQRELISRPLHLPLAAHYLGRLNIGSACAADRHKWVEK